MDYIVIKYDRDDLEKMNIGELVNNFTDIVLPVHPSIGQIQEFFKQKGYIPTSSKHIEDTDECKKKLLIDGIIYLELNRAPLYYSESLDDYIKFFANTARISKDDRAFLKQHYSDIKIDIRRECIRRIITTLETFYSTQISNGDLYNLERSIASPGTYEKNTAKTSLWNILNRIARKNLVPSKEDIKNDINKRRIEEEEKERRMEKNLNLFFSTTFPDKLRETLYYAIHNREFCIDPSRVWTELHYEAKRYGLDNELIELLFSQHNILTIEKSYVNGSFSDLVDFYLNNWDKNIKYHAGKISFGEYRQQITYNQKQNHKSVVDRWADYQRAKEADDTLTSELEIEIKELAKCRFKALLGEAFQKRSGSAIFIEEEFVLIDVLSHLEEVCANPHREENQFVAFQNMAAIEKYLKYIEKAFEQEFKYLCQTYKIPFKIRSAGNQKEKTYTLGEYEFFISEDYILGIFNSLEADEELLKQRYLHGYKKYEAINSMQYIESYIIGFIKKVDRNFNANKITYKEFRERVKKACNDNKLDTVHLALQTISVTIPDNESKEYLLAFMETTSYISKTVDDAGNVVFEISFTDLKNAYLNEMDILDDYLANSFAVENGRAKINTEKQPSLFKKYKILKFRRDDTHAHN